MTTEAKKEWNARYSYKIPHTTEYYLKCIGGGETPDVPGLKVLVAEEGLGAAGCYKGWLPTLIGYSAQGAFKFGLYEVFKDFYSNLAGEKFSKEWAGAIWLAGSASAEFCADIFLCPMEMIKVKMQTSAKGTVPLQLGAAINYMQTTPGTGFPFKSLVPLWSRQIPYTMANFYFFERVVRLFYAHIFTNPRDSYSKSTQLGITFASGYVDGIVCAIASHPADTLVSLSGKPANAGKGYGEIAKAFGYGNLFTKGLGARILIMIMIGTLTGLQWWI